jgi:hypothetical protein
VLLVGQAYTICTGGVVAVADEMTKLLGPPPAGYQGPPTEAVPAPDATVPGDEMTRLIGPPPKEVPPEPLGQQALNALTQIGPTLSYTGDRMWHGVQVARGDPPEAMLPVGPAPNPVAGYTGAVGQAVAEHPILSWLDLPGMVGGALAGETANQLFPNHPAIATAAGIVAGGARIPSGSLAHGGSALGFLIGEHLSEPISHWMAAAGSHISPAVSHLAPVIGAAWPYIRGIARHPGLIRYPLMGAVGAHSAQMDDNELSPTGIIAP